MNRYNTILAVVAVTALFGCATAPTPPTGDQDDKAYVTGSRLPVRDGSTTANVKGVTGKEDIDDMLNRATSDYVPPKGGPKM
jgi:hypothetical protein